VRGVTGNCRAWIRRIRVPLLSHTTDTPIYLFYGNAGVTSPQSNHTGGVWDSHYQTVYHLADNAANTTVVDSSVNGNNAANAANTSARSASGKIGNALMYNGNGDSSTSNASITISPTFTYSAWVKLGAVTPGWAGIVVTNHSRGGALTVSGDTAAYEFIYNAQQVYGGVSDTTSWHYLTGTWDGTYGRLYVDGNLVQTITYGAPSLGGAYPVIIGDLLSFGSPPHLYLNGTVDEARVSNIARLSDWITTEFNNQNNPLNFYGVGNETTP
jgi:hypothetical protein